MNFSPLGWGCVPKYAEAVPDYAVAPRLIADALLTPGQFWRRVGQIHELIRLAAQFVGQNGLAGPERGNHCHPGAFALNRLDQAAKIAIA